MRFFSQNFDCQRSNTVILLIINSFSLRFFVDERWTTCWSFSNRIKDIKLKKSSIADRNSFIFFIYSKFLQHMIPKKCWKFLKKKCYSITSWFQHHWQMFSSESYLSFVKQYKYAYVNVVMISLILRDITIKNGLKNCIYQIFKRSRVMKWIDLILRASTYPQRNRVKSHCYMLKLIYAHVRTKLILQKIIY